MGDQDGSYKKIFSHPEMIEGLIRDFVPQTWVRELDFRTLERRSRAHYFHHYPAVLITPVIITGVILAFARCLGEFGATITFVANIRGETQTLPLATLTQTPE